MDAPEEEYYDEEALLEYLLDNWDFVVEALLEKTGLSVEDIEALFYEDDDDEVASVELEALGCDKQEEPLACYTRAETNDSDATMLPEGIIFRGGLILNWPLVFMVIIVLGLVLQRLIAPTSKEAERKAAIEELLLAEEKKEKVENNNAEKQMSNRSKPNNRKRKGSGKASSPPMKNEDKAIKGKKYPASCKAGQPSKSPSQPDEQPNRLLHQQHDNGMLRKAPELRREDEHTIHQQVYEDSLAETISGKDSTSQVANEPCKRTAGIPDEPVKKADNMRQPHAASEDRLLQQVLEASLREMWGVDTSIEGITPTGRAVDDQARLHEGREREKAKVWKREAEQSKLRKQEAEQARLRKVKKREAEQTKLAKQRQREAEQTKLLKQEHQEAEQARQLEKRRVFWRDQIAFEEDTGEKLVRLLAAEFCRTHSDLSQPTLLRDGHAKRKLEAQARITFRELFDRRVIVREAAQQKRKNGWEGRDGTIQYWDKSKGKFHVAFQPLKGKNVRYVFLPLEQLETLPRSNQATGERQEKELVSKVHIASLYDGSDYDDEEDNDLVLEVSKEMVNEMLDARNVDAFLTSFCLRRNQEELRARQLKEKEQAKHLREERQKFWEERARFKNEALEKLVLLFATEFARQLGIFPPTLLEDSKVKEELEAQAAQTFSELFEEPMPSRVRVVRDSKQNDQRSRIGIIQHWDGSKGKFRVTFETKTKKGHIQYAYVLPDDLEALRNKPTKMKKKQKNPLSSVFITSLFKGESFLYEVEKSTVDELLRAEAIEQFLYSFHTQRNEDALRTRKLELEECVAEEEARKRRAEKLRREQQEWRQQKQEFHKRKERLKEMKRARKQARSKKQKGMRDERGHADFRSCQCPACTLEREFARKFFEEFFGRRRGPSFFSRPKNDDFFFGEDGEYDSDDGDGWDARFDHMHETKMAEKNAEAADLLGVEADAPEGEINRAFRRLSLTYHPDKFRPERHTDGKTKEDAEELFKQFSEARDDMLLYRERKAS